MDGVRIDSDLSHDFTNGRQLIPRLEQTQAHRLSDLVNELAVRWYAGSPIQSKVNHRVTNVHMYYYISTF